MTIEYVATCLFGLESLLGEEIEKLGDKMSEFNMESLLSELNIKDVGKLLSQYIK